MWWRWAVAWCCGGVLGGWIDDDTPASARQVFSLYDGTQFDLVMSDEFETAGRAFGDGNDPRWTAVHKNDYTNKALHYYHEDYVKTSNGFLNLTTSSEDTIFTSVQVHKKKFVHEKLRKHYRSGMVQGWNKFCFTGGVVEIVAQLPGRWDVGGLWPGMWMMGNLARATYVASSNRMWPWSRETCHRSDQKRQEISGCEPAPHFGLNAKQGRGAPEIDLLEVMPGTGKLPWGLKKPYHSTSLQLSPASATRPYNGAQPAPGEWYEGMEYGNGSLQNVFFYGMHLEDGPPDESYFADAISANTPIGASEFNELHTYRLEWVPGADGHIRWYKDGEFLFGIQASDLGHTGGLIPQEPMYLILNTALSSTWGFPAPCPPGCACDCFDCKNPACACALAHGFCESLPAHFLVDSVRVYQDQTDARSKVGCSTDTHPSRKFIEAHKARYADPDAASKRPLKQVTRGGGKCVHRDTCGGQGDEASECVRGRCRCARGRAGPTCLAPDGTDDIDYERAPSIALRALWVPPGLLLAALIAFFAYSLLCLARVHALRRDPK